jgi:NADH-quinone oxidoreductase subunit J
VEAAVFVIAAAMVLLGALGVVLRSNPVHCALSLVLTLFGIAVLFVAQDAHFLAAVQVIVYAGAIVVLFLFVIMLLGVDRTEDIRVDPLRGQRPAALVVGVLGFGLLLAAMFVRGDDEIVTGQRSLGGSLEQTDASGQAMENIRLLSRSLFSDYVFAFEVTSVLLVIAVIGTVVLARRPPRPEPAAIDDDDEPAVPGTRR